MSKRCQILQAEAARLRLEITRAKQWSAEQAGLPPLPKDAPTAVYVLQEQIEDLQQTLTRVHHDQKFTEETLEREKTLLQETKTIGEALQTTLDKLQTADNALMHQDAVRTKRAELAKLRQQHTQTMGDLLQFLETHYPPVHAADQPHPAKRRRSAPASSDITFSLKDMLEDLMNLSVSHPDDPYYTLVPGKFWEPHVQLLLNAGIVVHHPKDASRIKLFEFHIN